MPVPDGVDLATAAVLTCAGMTAMHATTLSGLRLGDTAVVDGIGGVGSLVVQAAAHAGARVIAIADSDEKIALAKELGARRRARRRAGRATRPWRSALRGLTGGRGTDVFFELVGTTQTMNAGIRSLAKGGTVRLDGLHGPVDRHPPDRVHPARDVVRLHRCRDASRPAGRARARGGRRADRPDRRDISDGRDPRCADGAAGSGACSGDRSSSWRSDTTKGNPRRQDGIHDSQPQIDFLDEPMRLYIDGAFVETERACPR